MAVDCYASLARGIRTLLYRKPMENMKPSDRPAKVQAAGVHMIILLTVAL